LRWDQRRTYWVWIGIPADTGPLRILMRGREDNIKMDFKETGLEGVDISGS